LALKDQYQDLAARKVRKYIKAKIKSEAKVQKQCEAREDPIGRTATSEQRK